MSHILIIDSQPSRMEKLAEVCRSVLPEVDVYIRRINLQRWDKHRQGNVFDRSEIPDTPAEIAFRHYRDERETLLIPPKVEIWYGGNGLEEDRGKLWNIHYPLSSEWDVERLLSLLYVQQLWAWAIHPQRDAVELPYVLCPPASIEHLAALFILCQGYLAAHDDSRLEGWEALVHEYPEFPAIACAHKEKVRQPGWWLTAFSEAADWKKRLEEEIESLAALKQKGVEKSVIAALIGAFAQGGDSLTLGQDDSADLVYRAYDTLRVLLQK